MSGPLWLTVRAFSHVCFVINGPGSGRMISSVTGRMPQYSRRLRGYVTQERTAIDVMALAQEEGRKVRFDDRRSDDVVELSARRKGQDVEQVEGPRVVQLPLIGGDGQ